jgi:hypothetical protein
MEKTAITTLPPEIPSNKAILGGTGVPPVLAQAICPFNGAGNANIHRTLLPESPLRKGGRKRRRLGSRDAFSPNNAIFVTFLPELKRKVDFCHVGDTPRLPAGFVILVQDAGPDALQVVGMLDHEMGRQRLPAEDFGQRPPFIGPQQL